MQTECIAALRTQRMPTTRNEEYRFTDVGPLLQIQPKAGLFASDISSISSCSKDYHLYRSSSNCLPCCPFISSAVHVTIEVFNAIARLAGVACGGCRIRVMHPCHSRCLCAAQKCGAAYDLKGYGFGSCMRLCLHPSFSLHEHDV